MRNFLSVRLAAATLCGFATHAQAADAGVYLGAAVIRANVDQIFGSGSPLKIDDTSWKGFLGFKPPLLPVGVEVEYIDLGRATRQFGFGSGQANAKAFAAFTVGYLPIPLPIVDVFGKLGVARWRLDGYQISPGLFAIDERGTEFAWGAGVQFHLQRFAIRAEYEGFDIKNTAGARLYSVGALYTF